MLYSDNGSDLYLAFSVELYIKLQSDVTAKNEKNSKLRDAR